MTLNTKFETKFFTNRRVFLIGAILWLIVVFASLAWNWRNLDKTIFQLAMTEARATFNTNILYRSWAAMHGGVYVPPTEKTPPHPYLANHPERDVTTTTGKKLTLLNPAYMIRQVHELSTMKSGVRSHLTSLKPVNPDNAADDWEKKALISFESGVEEASSFGYLDENPYLRFMKPLFIEVGCLKCHAVQGYKEGDIRGGISVMVPYASYLNIAQTQRNSLLFWHSVIGIFGVAGFWLAHQILSRSKQELIKAKEAAEAANAAKSQFLAIISHEVRTPMNGIMGFLQLLERTELNGQQEKFINFMKLSSENLLAVINDILDVSKIESGKFELEEIPFDLREAIQGVLLPFTAKARDQGLDFGVVIDADIPKKVVGDPTRLKQVIINLVNNALKFTREGEIHINAGLLYQSENDITLLFCIKDTGIGIAPDEIDKIFMPFIQADASSTRKYGGTGLGLSICKSIIKMMNGDIKVESTTGEGSSFSFTVTFKRFMAENL